MGHQSIRSKFAISEARVSSGESGTAVKELSERSKRIATAKGVRRFIGKVTNKLRSVTRDEGSQSRGTATAESPMKRCKRISIAQDYRILPEVIGKGTDGEVRKCIHLRSSELCAVKTVRKLKDRIPRHDLIFYEIAVMKKVRHANVVALRDVFEDEDEVHIVMEMCHGGELFDRIVEKAELNKKSRIQCANLPVPSCFRERDAARIVRSLLEATSHLHSKDIVHRDIKPENLLFAEKDDDESPVKLIDFGSAVRHARDATPLTAIVGSPFFMAPEVLKGSYDRSCDLWSIGVVTYILLSGRPPFNGQSDDVVYRKIRRGLDHNRMDTSELWDGISKEAKDFVRCLLVMNPTERLTADTALDHPWLKIEGRVAA